MFLTYIKKSFPLALQCSKQKGREGWASELIQIQQARHDAQRYTTVNVVLQNVVAEQLASTEITVGGAHRRYNDSRSHPFGAQTPIHFNVFLADFIYTYVYSSKHHPKVLGKSDAPGSSVSQNTRDRKPLHSQVYPNS